VGEGGVRNFIQICSLKKKSGDIISQPLFRIFLVTVLVSLLLMAGCAMHSGQQIPANPDGSMNLSNPTGESGITRNTTPVLPALAVINITIVPERHLPSAPVTSFAADYVLSECDEGNTTFNMSFTLISGLDGPHHIQYELIPLGNTASLQNDGAITASINPSDFIAQPGTVYVSSITVSVGPNQTGEKRYYGDYESWSNPIFFYSVNVTSDGKEMPELNRTLHLGKYCHYFPGGGLFGRQLHSIPFLFTDSNPITVHHDIPQSKNITIGTYNGGIRELSFIINGPVIRNYTGQPILWRTQPVPPGMSIMVNPPSFIAVNSETYTTRLTISVNDSTPVGDYEFPLDLCYRDVNPSETTSEYYPFSQNLSCSDSLQLAVAVK
jgi:hypothetical protein